MGKKKKKKKSSGLGAFRTPLVASSPPRYQMRFAQCFDLVGLRIVYETIPKKGPSIPMIRTQSMGSFICGSPSLLPTHRHLARFITAYKY